MADVAMTEVSQQRVEEALVAREAYVRDNAGCAELQCDFEHAFEMQYCYAICFLPLSCNLCHLHCVRRTLSFKTLRALLEEDLGVPPGTLKAFRDVLSCGIDKVCWPMPSYTAHTHVDTCKPCSLLLKA